MFISEIFTKKYLPSLDGLRAISILIVIIAHLLHSEFIPAKAPVYFLVKHGLLGVNIFFVISGLLITTLLIRERNNSGKIDLKRFYIRRALRILPVLFLYLFFVIALTLIFDLKISLLSFAGPFIFLGNIHYFNQSVYFAHFWSLAYEEQFYFVIPFFLSHSIDKYYKAIGAYLFLFPLIILVYGISSFSNPAISHVFRFFYNFYPLAVGSFISISIFKNKLRSNNEIGKLNVFVPIVMLILIFALNIEAIGDIKSDFLLSIKNMLNAYVIAAFIIICICMNTKNMMYKMLNNRLTIKVGILSYSLYVFQQVFTTRVPWVLSSNALYSAILNMLFLAIVAYLSYTYYESKFLKIKSRFK